ncbi:hypothetical protein [Leucobacter sp. cx-169]|uniref:hypothetical protein n=1 Tax=Leucobacter sp. cx-169 TaxID=2770549 RepID=UPI00165E219F|nr:hypothetical protein [Leucobacter sp. cx-169]MBC9927345.1 hypothetical protein [Leucobacter sp. cx-169]
MSTTISVNAPAVSEDPFAGLNRELLLAQKEANAARANAQDIRAAAENAGRRHSAERAQLQGELNAANCVISAMKDLVTQAQLEAKINSNGFIPTIAVADLAELLLTRSAR